LSTDQFDTGGQTSIRPYWRCYYANTAAVVFVVDATDHTRLETAAEELQAMLNEDELREAALLVFANKQDQPGVLGAAEISEALKLPSLKERSWSIFGCSAVTGDGELVTRSLLRSKRTANVCDSRRQRWHGLASGNSPLNLSTYIASANSLTENCPRRAVASFIISSVHTFKKTAGRGAVTGELYHLITYFVQLSFLL